MRFLLVLFLLFIFGYCQYSNEENEVGLTSIKDLIDAQIEKLRAAIPDIITVENATLDLSGNDIISGHLEVHDLELGGINLFDINLKYIFGAPKSYVLTFLTVDLKLNYMSDVQLLNQPLLSVFGDGDVSINLTNLTITGKLDVVLGSSLNVTLKSMNLNLEAIKFEIDGLLNDTELSESITDYLNDNFVTLFNDNQEEIGNILDGALNKIIGDILNGNSTVGLNYADASDYYDEMDEVDYNVEIIGRLFQTIIERIELMLN